MNTKGRPQKHSISVLAVLPVNGPVLQHHANAAALLGIQCSFRHDVQKSLHDSHCNGGCEVCINSFM